MKKSLIIGLALITFSATHASTYIAESKTLNFAESVTPLCAAISKGDLDAVKKFVEYGADVNQKSNGMTPLMMAARYNKVEIIKLLIANGADVKVKNDRGQTALKIAELSNATEAAALLSNQR